MFHISSFSASASWSPRMAVIAGGMGEWETSSLPGWWFLPTLPLAPCWAPDSWSQDTGSWKACSPTAGGRHLGRTDSGPSVKEVAWVSVCITLGICASCKELASPGHEGGPALGLQPQWPGGQTLILDQIMVLFIDQCSLITMSC